MELWLKSKPTFVESVYPRRLLLLLRQILSAFSALLGGLVGE